MRNTNKNKSNRNVEVIGTVAVIASLCAAAIAGGAVISKSAKEIEAFGRDITMVSCDGERKVNIFRSMTRTAGGVYVAKITAARGGEKSTLRVMSRRPFRSPSFVWET